MRTSPWGQPKLLLPKLSLHVVKDYAVAESRWALWSLEDTGQWGRGLCCASLVLSCAECLPRAGS